MCILANALFPKWYDFQLQPSESGFQFGESSRKDNHFENAFRGLRKLQQRQGLKGRALSSLDSLLPDCGALQRDPPHCSKAATAHGTLSKLLNKAHMTAHDLASAPLWPILSFAPAAPLGQLSSAPQISLLKHEDGVALTRLPPLPWNRAWLLGEVQ